MQIVADHGPSLVDLLTVQAVLSVIDYLFDLVLRLLDLLFGLARAAVRLAFGFQLLVAGDDSRLSPPAWLCPSPDRIPHPSRTIPRC